MAGPRVEIDILSTSYKCGDAAQQRFIEQEVAAFNASYDELYNYDRRSEWLVGVLGAVWFFGSLGTKSALIIAVAFIGLSHEFFGRPEYAKQHQNQLNHLYELYKWCIRAGRDISKDEAFLKLTETLIPFIDYNDLKKPFDSWNGISEQMSAAILKSQHRLRYVSDRQAAPEPSGMIGYLGSSIKSVFVSPPKQDAAVVAAAEAVKSEDTLANRASLALSQAKFKLYGRSTGPQPTLLEQGKQMIEPLTLLKGLATRPK